MNEIIPTALKELTELVRKEGYFKVYVISVLYFGTLFFLSVGFIILYDLLFNIDFNKSSSMLIVATIFIIVYSTDIILISKAKITPTMLVWVIIISPLLALYKLFKDTDLFNLNKKNTPAEIKKYIFPR